MSPTHLAYAAFALALQLAAALALGFLEPLHEHAWAAMALHGGVTAAAVAWAKVSLQPWRGWAVGVAATYAILNGALTGFMRALCILGCPPGTPWGSMLAWVAIDVAISGVVLLAVMAWGPGGPDPGRERPEPRGNPGEAAPGRRGREPPWDPRRP